MERRNAALSILLLVGLAGLTAALVQPGRLPTAPPSSTPAGVTTVLPSRRCIIVDFTALSFADLVDQSDKIYFGTVTGFSRQEYLSHTIYLSVLNGISGPPSFGQAVEVVAPGSGPLDNCGPPIHDLAVGDQVILFARRTDIATGPATTRGVLALMGPTGYYKLGDDGLYHGGPDREAISRDDLRTRIARTRGAKTTLDEIGEHVEEPPPGMEPALSQRLAIALARATYGQMLGNAPNIKVDARFVLLTDSVRYHAPVWLVTFSGVKYYGMGGPRPMGGVTPLPPIPNSEINVIIDATTGEELGMFSYR